MTQATTNTPTLPSRPTLTESQLWAWSTTKAIIIQHAHNTFNARLSITKTKMELVQLYLNLTANQGMPTAPTANAHPANTTNPTSTKPRPHQRKITSNWNIQHLPNTETIEFVKPFRGNMYSMVKAIEHSLQQALGEAAPPITILAGRWWSPLSSNFTLTLVGNLRVTLV